MVLGRQGTQLLSQLQGVKPGTTRGVQQGMRFLPVEDYSE